MSYVNMILDFDSGSGCDTMTSFELNPDDVGSMFIWYVSILLQGYMFSQPKDHTLNLTWTSHNEHVISWTC
jgi:hypothetical protein